VRPALLTAVPLAAIQQLSSINAVIYYAPSIMEKTGLGSSNSILYSVVVGVINVAATVVSFRLVDRAGRRPLLLWSLGAMFVSRAGDEGAQLLGDRRRRPPSLGAPRGAGGLRQDNPVWRPGLPFGVPVLPADITSA
jgi:hypothetical protein